MRESKNCRLLSFPRDPNLLKRNIKYSLMWPSRSHVTNAIIKNAISSEIFFFCVHMCIITHIQIQTSSKFRKHNHVVTTHLKPVLQNIAYTYSTDQMQGIYKAKLFAFSCKCICLLV